MVLPVNDKAFLAFFKNTPLEIEAKALEQTLPQAAPQTYVEVKEQEEVYIQETSLKFTDEAEEKAEAPEVEKPRRPRRS